MKFLLIVHHDEEAFQKIDKEKRQQMLAESIDLTHQLHGAGQYIHASPLQPAETAVMVRVREGKSMVTDGPFAETKEQIAGYFLIDAQDCRTSARRAHRNGRGQAASRNQGIAKGIRATDIVGSCAEQKDEVSCKTLNNKEL